MLEGAIQRVQHASVGLTALELDATAGSAIGPVTVTGLDSRRLSVLSLLRPGDEVRISGLRRRAGSDTFSGGTGWVKLARTSHG